MARNLSTSRTTIEVGGRGSPLELIEELEKRGIAVGMLGETMLQDAEVSREKNAVHLTQIRIREMGFANGTHIDQVFDLIPRLGGSLCALEDVAEACLQDRGWINREEAIFLTVAAGDSWFRYGFQAVRIGDRPGARLRGIRSKPDYPLPGGRVVIFRMPPKVDQARS